VGYSAGVRATIPDFEEMRRRIVALLVNDPPTEKDAIQDLAARSNAPVFVVDKLLDELERKGFIHVIRTFGGTVIPRINRTLTRELE
jgi:DNA-binding IscR family transcriptional regulator